ncbi:hypothetical protein WN944_006397 [Citrus x changshan-huyou]|uniref:Uncharacterized protein n=1 Tax=Citrus x changshan-huyou TaxID=2935761 RepID=A0AAP0MQJ2_9ROSI
MNIDDGANLSSRTVCHDDELLEAEDDFHARKYKNKVTGDPKIALANLVDDLKTMYRVEVDPQKVYKAKRKILKSAAGGDHVESFKQL